MIAIVGGPGWVDEVAVRLFVKGLPDGTLVGLDDESWTAVTAAATRQCRCSGLVGVQYRLPGAGRAAITARSERDAVLFGAADRVVVFGELPADRAATLKRFEEAGKPVERRSR